MILRADRPCAALPIMTVTAPSDCCYIRRQSVQHLTLPKRWVHIDLCYAELCTIIRQCSAEVAASGLQPHSKKLQSSQTRSAGCGTLLWGSHDL